MRLMIILWSMQLLLVLVLSVAQANALFKISAYRRIGDLFAVPDCPTLENIPFPAFPFDMEPLHQIRNFKHKQL